jgi:uncharacterized membrane protein (DUF2068 family)
MGTVETRPRHPPPEAIDTHASLAGLRTVASFEALKGFAVLALGIALLFVHKDAETFADSLLFHLHISIDRRFAQSFLNAASKLSDARLWTIAAATFSYSTVRFVESWGLWHRRVWAEWFALLSGALYLPLEILKLAQYPDWEHVAVLLINIVIILYMLYIRISECRWPANCADDTSKQE